MLIYCYDTSGLTNTSRFYSFKSFPSLWNRIETLIEEGRLICSQKVHEELRKQDDLLLRWANKNGKVFIGLNAEQYVLAKQIVDKYPDIVDKDKETEDADPYVIALAILKQRDVEMLGDTCVVVSAETEQKKKNKTKIPVACEGFSVRHMYFVEVIDREGWAF